MDKPLTLGSSLSSGQGNSRTCSRRCTSHEENKRAARRKRLGRVGLRRPTGLEEEALHSGLDTKDEVEAGRKGASDDSNEGWG